MILEMIALGSVLYTGYKSYKEKSEKENIEDEKERSKSVLEEKVSQISRQPKAVAVHNKAGGPNKAPPGRSLADENDTDILTSAIGLGFSFFGPVYLLSAPFVGYSLRRNFQKAYKMTREGESGIDTIISTTIGGCFLLGYYFPASLITLIVKISTKLSMKVTQESQQELIKAFGEQVEGGWVLEDGVEVRKKYEEIKKGDVVVVSAGEVIPIDGTVSDGKASVDQQILTGESRPVERKAGEEVFASTVVLSGKINIDVQKAGNETTVAKITQILNNTVSYKSTVQLRADKVSTDLVNPALIAGGVGLPLLGPSGALAVLNSHPKNKMMAIAPITLINYLGIASRNGILIKDGRSLELLHKVDTVVFDKTGTLTVDQPHVGGIHSFSTLNEDEILTYAAAAENKQSHPLARAILDEAERRDLTLPPIDDSEYAIGYGLTVGLSGKTVHVGSDRFISEAGISLPSRFRKMQKTIRENGSTLILVAVDSELVGGIELFPTVRDEAKDVLRLLKKRRGIKHTYIISGDHEIPTRNLANELGIDHYFAETLPGEKAEIIEKLQKEGRFICYVGDGINDSIALKKSQVSVSLNGAAAAATDTAQIVLMDAGINHLNYLFDLAGNYNKNMNTSFALMLIPSLFCVTGAFLLGFGVPQTIGINIVGIVLGVGNSTIPLLTQKKHSRRQILPGATDREDARETTDRKDARETPSKKHRSNNKPMAVLPAT